MSHQRLFRANNNYVLRLTVTWQRAKATAPSSQWVMGVKHVTALTKVQRQECDPSSWRREEGGTPCYPDPLFCVPDVASVRLED